MPPQIEKRTPALRALFAAIRGLARGVAWGFRRRGVVLAGSYGRVGSTDARVDVTDASITHMRARVGATDARVGATDTPIDATDASITHMRAPIDATDASLEATDLSTSDICARVSLTDVSEGGSLDRTRPRRSRIAPPERPECGCPFLDLGRHLSDPRPTP